MDNTAILYHFIVVIPCYNDRDGLFRSLKTITYNNGNYAILVIDDGSQQPISATIHVLRLSTNHGITRALNTGLSWISERNGTNFHCDYIARLDCGDMCSPSRFTRQITFLNAHPDIDLLGSWCVFEDFETGEKFVYSTPTEDKDIRRAMYFRNIFIHPTVMWRSSIMKNISAYPENFPHAEDYGLFYQWMDASYKTAVIPEKLVICRINPRGLSLANRNHQLQSRMQVVRTFGKNKLLKAMGVLKLRALMAIPYPVIFKMKKLLAGER
jgi:glycosyltransferase involved in cell wall biosynthesis